MHRGLLAGPSSEVLGRGEISSPTSIPPAPGRICKLEDLSK
jgi:hypothetical protein